MVIPQGVNIPMPRPFGGIPPAISKTPLGEDAAGGELITVSLVGEIGPITQYLEMFEALDTANENDQVRIVLDTPGGDVYTSQQIVGRMESCKAKVTTVASGLVASAGTFIWLYGQKQEIERWARFMFHSSLHGDWGKSLAIQENAAELVKFMAQILSNAERRGILIAAEVQRILKGKGDVEISAAEARKRLAILAEGDTGDPNPDDDPGNGDDDDDPNNPPNTGDDDGDQGEGAPSAKKLTKKTTVKKTKKRISQGDVDPEPGDDDDDGGDEGGEGDDNGDTGENAPPSEGGESIESMFTAICDANGVDPATTETTTTENEPVETPANKRKPVKKSKKRRSEGGEGGEPNPATGDDDDDGTGEGDPNPETGDDDDDDDTGDAGDAGNGDEGEGDAPAAKRGKKGKGKKRRAQGDGDDGGEGEPPAEGGDDNGDEGAAGEPPAEGDDKTSVADLFDTICEENGVAAPPPDEGGDPNPAPGEGEGDDDDDDNGEGAGDDGVTAPEGCGKGRKSKKPAKKRRGEEPGTTEITEPGEADQNSHLRQVPSSRHW